MQERARATAAAMLLVALIGAPLFSSASDVQGQGVGPPPAPRTSPSGQESLLRLYGCGDRATDEGLPPHAIDPAARAPVPLDEDDPDDSIHAQRWRDEADWRQRDGRPDCTGDALHLEPALRTPRDDAATRRALVVRDQLDAISVRYLPLAWHPGPGRGTNALPAAADPVRPDLGLFDADSGSGPDGRFDPRYEAEERADGSRLPLDRDPYDGFADHARRNVDTTQGHDLYFEAVAIGHEVAWTAASGAPAPLHDGDTFLLPTAPDRADGGLGTAQDPTGSAVPVQWVADPFGIVTGTRGAQQPGDDDAAPLPRLRDAGALMTAPVRLTSGAEFGFLDHAIRVGVLGTDRATVEVSYVGGRTPEPMPGALVLDASAGTTDPTGPWAPSDAIVFADRIGTTREPPVRPAGPSPDRSWTDSTADDTWFVVLESVVTDQSGERHATFRFGRMVGEHAPWNTFLAAGALHRITDVGVDTQGRLHRFAWARVLPLGGPVALERSGLVLDGHAVGAPLPLPEPFDARHLRVDTIDPPLERDEQGFLAAAPNARGALSRSELGWTAGSPAPRDRLRHHEPLLLTPIERGHEGRLGRDVLPRDWLAFDVGANATGAPQVGDLWVDSVLLDDQALLGGGHLHGRFVWHGDSGPPVHLIDEDAVRLHGPPAPDSRGTTIEFAPRLLEWTDHRGQIRTATELAHQVITLNVSYDPALRLDPGRNPLAYRPVYDDEGRLVDRSPQDHAADVEPVAAAGPGEPAMAAPFLTVSQTYGLLSRSDLSRRHVAPSDRTLVLMPHSDRDPHVPGLDSADLDGDGDDDPVRLRGFWDADGGDDGTGAFTTTGPYDPETDLVWLQSTPITLRTGRAATFFDHGLELAGVAGEQARFVLLDPSANAAPARLQEVDGVQPGARDCIVFDQSGRAEGIARTCNHIAPTAPAGGDSVTGDAWWAQVLAVGSNSVTLRFNRVVTPEDLSGDADQRRFLVGGVLHQWLPPVLNLTDPERPRITSIGFQTHHVLSDDVYYESGGRGATLRPHPLGLPLRLPFPWALAGPRLQLVQDPVHVARDAQGFGLSGASEYAAGRDAAPAPLIVPLETSAGEAAGWIDRPDRARLTTIGAFQDPSTGIPTVWLPDGVPPHLDTGSIEGLATQPATRAAKAWARVMVNDGADGVRIEASTRGLESLWWHGDGDDLYVMAQHPAPPSGGEPEDPDDPTGDGTGDDGGDGTGQDTQNGTTGEENNGSPGTSAIMFVVAVLSLLMVRVHQGRNGPHS